MKALQVITSRDNAQLKAIRRLAQTSNNYKEAGQIWLEGEHLCDAYLQAAPMQGMQLEKAVVSLSSKPHWLARVDALCEVIVLPDALFEHISGLPSSGGIGFVLSLPEQTNIINKTMHTVVLDRVQDAGNVGSILRSAAAFGVTQVLALQGTALLWSPKVLRSAMGAHFSLRIVEGLNVSDVDLDVPILATDVHGGSFLHELQVAKIIPNPCAWVMGHEGQGVSHALLDKASVRVNISQIGQESLNVAAAAAVCLYASMTHGHAD